MSIYILSHKVSVTFGLLFCFSSIIAEPVFAATPGSMSGELLQNNPMLTTPLPPSSDNREQLTDPETRAEEGDINEGPSLWVKKIVVNNIPASSLREVNELTEKYGGKRMTFSALRQVTVNITALLQHNGERLSYAYIPDQKITDGSVTFNIMKGHIESIQINRNQSLVKDRVINRYIKQMIAMKDNIASLEESMSSVSNLPGVGNFSSFLRAGTEPGGSALGLDLTASPRVDGMVVVDNMGSISSGRDRVGVQFNLNSPLGLGDRLQVLAYAAPDFLQINNDSKHGNTLIGRLSYDAPFGTLDARLGAAFSRVSYKLGGPVLAGLGDGFADVATLYSSFPLLSSNMRNLNLGITADFKRMDDKFWGLRNARHSPLLSVQISGDNQGSLFGKPNILQYEIAPVVGRLSNSDEWNGAGTKGNFAKLTGSVNYLQGIWPGIHFSMNLRGQQASKNLDGAEKISLGGAYAVRAYGNSAASADSAWIITPALNLAVPAVENASVELFFDYARGKMQKFAPSQQTVALKGYGVGVTYSFNNLMFINGSYAWRWGHDALLSSQNKATGWITAGVRF